MQQALEVTKVILRNITLGKHITDLNCSRSTVEQVRSARKLWLHMATSGSDL